VVDSIVDLAFPDSGMNAYGLSGLAAAVTRLSGRFPTFLGMTVALYSN